MADKHVTVNWFEIPVADLERAARFYRTVMQVELVPMDMPEAKMQAFQNQGRPVGCLAQGQHNQAASTGTRVFLEAHGDITGILDRVADAGGKVVLPNTSIGDYGHIGQFIDTEGNQVGLHTM